jgi:hypothetical protein
LSSPREIPTGIIAVVGTIDKTARIQTAFFRRAIIPIIEGFNAMDNHKTCAAARGDVDSDGGPIGWVAEAADDLNLAAYEESGHGKSASS